MPATWICGSGGGAAAAAGGGGRHDRRGRHDARRGCEAGVAEHVHAQVRAVRHVDGAAAVGRDRVGRSGARRAASRPHARAEAAERRAVERRAAHDVACSSVASTEPSGATATPTTPEAGQVVTAPSGRDTRDELLLVLGDEHRSVGGDGDAARVIEVDAVTVTVAVGARRCAGRRRPR